MEEGSCPCRDLEDTDLHGNVVFEYKPPAGDQVIRAEHAYLITSILSDNQARSPMFGANSVLTFPFQLLQKPEQRMTIGIIGLWGTHPI